MKKILVTTILLIFLQNTYAENGDKSYTQKHIIEGYPEYESINYILSKHLENKKNNTSKEQYIKYINLLGKQLYTLRKDNINGEINTQKERVISILSYIVMTQIFQHDIDNIFENLGL